MQKITYGVLHYNILSNKEANDVFVECVESLVKNRSTNFESEIYLIDQGNNKKEKDLILSLANKHRVNAVLLKNNLGISGGINLINQLGFKSDFISLVTSDAIFPLDLDNILISEMQNDDKIWQICPLSDISELDYQKLPVDLNKSVTKCIAQELTIQFWKKECFNKIGGFREKFRACYENLDYALRIFLSGHDVAISNRIVCKHYHAMSRKSGARNHTYDGYEIMSDGFNQEIVASHFNFFWPRFNKSFMYSPELLTENNREYLRNIYESNTNFIQY